MKPSKEQLKTAKGIFKSNPNCETLYVNNKGEFFTSENLAKHSVKDAKKDLAKITRSIEVEVPEAPKTDAGSNDTGAGSPAPKAKAPKKKKEAKPSAEARIKTIEAAKTIDEVKALLKGENATTVKKAGEDRIVALTKKETGADAGTDENSGDKGADAGTDENSGDGGADAGTADNQGE